MYVLVDYVSPGKVLEKILRLQLAGGSHQDMSVDRSE